MQTVYAALPVHSMQYSGKLLVWLAAVCETTRAALDLSDWNVRRAGIGMCLHMIHHLAQLLLQMPRHLLVHYMYKPMSCTEEMKILHACSHTDQGMSHQNSRYHKKLAAKCIEKDEVNTGTTYR